MGAMGASATAITLTTVAFAVTGISAKINKAASKVFGEDLVQIGNIFGAAYGAFSGAFTGASSAAEAGANAAGNGAFLGEGVASGVEAWDGAMSLGDMAGGAESLSSMGDMANAVDYGSELAGQADAIGQMNGDVGDFTSATSESANVFDAIDPNDPIAAANQTQQPQSLLPNTQGQGAAGTQAAGSQASGSNAAGAGAARDVVAPPNVVKPPPAASRSFFDKLMFDDKGGINPSTLRVGGQVLAGYGKSKAEQELYDRQVAEARRRASQGVGFRVTQ